MLEFANLPPRSAEKVMRDIRNILLHKMQESGQMPEPVRGPNKDQERFVEDFLNTEMCPSM